MVSFLKINILYYFYFIFFFTKLPPRLFLCKIMKTKNSYHTAIILKAQLGMLSKRKDPLFPTRLSP
ncbi:hypothetical protein LEP1GSC108_0033, partial [Leptospira weilii str. UI 13098]